MRTAGYFQHRKTKVQGPRYGRNYPHHFLRYLLILCLWAIAVVFISYVVSLSNGVIHVRLSFRLGRQTASYSSGRIHCRSNVWSDGRSYSILSALLHAYEFILKFPLHFLFLARNVPHFYLPANMMKWQVCFSGRVRTLCRRVLFWKIWRCAS